MSEWCERKGGRMSKWPSTLWIDFVVIPPKVRLCVCACACVCVFACMCVLFNIPCHPGTAISLISAARLCVCVRPFRYPLS